jgi:hypothetical protein
VQRRAAQERATCAEVRAAWGQKGSDGCREKLLRRAHVPTTTAVAVVALSMARGGGGDCGERRCDCIVDVQKCWCRVHAVLQLLSVLLQACRRAGVLNDAKCSCAVALARLAVRNVLRCRDC